MMKLKLNALRAFAAVYEKGGVRPAARALGISHSSVSRHLAELEAWIGVTLIHPTSGRRNLSFTPQGEALGQATTASFRDMLQIVESLRESRSDNSVLIGAPASIATRWLLPRLPDFELAHRNLEVSVIVDQKLEDLERLGVDVAIRFGSLPASSGNAEPLMDDALYPVMSPAFWEKMGRPSEPEDLLGLRLLHDRDPDATWEAWRREFGPPDLAIDKGPRFTSTDLILRAASQGQGVALARHRLAQDDVASGLLCRPLDERSVDIPAAYWLVLPSHFAPRATTLEVVKWLKREAAGRTT